MWDDDSKYDDYAEQYDPQRNDRQARRIRKQKGNHVAKKSQADIMRDIAEPTALEGDTFATSYKPSRYESTWLLQSLKPFLQQEYISDVVAQVRGGKEASVYRCAARQGMGVDWLAAKVYRPRMFRQLRNDKMYREGRTYLTADGHVQRENEERVIRAIGKKTEFGRQVEHTSWLMHEFTTLEKLYAAGASVPRPVAAAENALLMGYIGDEDGAAPALSDVVLNAGEAKRLLHETLRNVELLLAAGFIHGDLSAYNILYLNGEITLIDFPQVTDANHNSQARFILERDIERVCAYFARYGAAANARAISQRLWKRYVEPAPEMKAADLSRLLGTDELPDG